MIINAQQSNIETIGDIQEFKTGIDPKNLEYITTLLSSNLNKEFPKVTGGFISITKMHPPFKCDMPNGGASVIIKW